MRSRPTSRPGQPTVVVVLAALLGALATAGLAGVDGPSWPEEGRLFGSQQQQAFWDFGSAVALSGDLAIVGAHQAEIEGVSNRGEAYIFRRVNGVWAEEQRLLASDGDENDFFGHSVGIDGDTAMIGAFAEGEGVELSRGAVYVFERVGAIWIETQKLQSSDGDTQDHFGRSLSFDGETLLVGAPRAGPGAITGGAAYTFTFDGVSWSEQHKLFDPLTESSDAFGHAVSLDENRALIGAFSDGTGSAYTFVRSGEAWALEEKLEPLEPASPSNFGWSVALWGRTAVIGAPQEESDGLPQRGALYVFAFDTGIWSETQHIIPPSTHAQSSFGRSAALEGSTLLVGSELNFGGDIERGVVYEFRPDAGGDWQEVQWFAAPIGQTLDSFGEAIDIDGQHALFGNPDNISVTPPGGTAWVLGKPPIFVDGFESGDTSAWSTKVP